MKNIFLIIAISLLLIGDIGADNIDVRTINNNGTLTIKIQNTTNTYSTNQDFDNTIQVQVSGGKEIEQVIACNETILRSVVNNEIALANKDEQSWFEGTVLPSTTSLKSNESALYNCQANYGALQQERDFYNKTHIPYLDFQVKAVTNERLYWVIGILIMFFLLVLFVANQTGILRRGKEIIQSKMR